MMDYGYYNAMDREEVLPINQIGASTNPFQHQTEALKARIFHGASRIEFSFFGQGKSNKEQPSPESFGRVERQDMRELAEFNKIQTSTHATVGINGLSGFSQGNFSEDARKGAIDELKRAIEFASDATTGGAVVFHTGEAPRSFYSKWGGEFKKHQTEDIEEEHYLVDPITKQMIARIKDNERIAFPKYKLDEKGERVYLKDENGKDVTDELLGAKIPQYEMDKNGNIQTEIITFKNWQEKEEKRIRDEERREVNEEDKKNMVKDFFKQQQLKDIIYFVGQSKGFEDRYKEGLREREKIIKALNYYKELKEKVPKEDWWKYQKDVMKDHYGHPFVPPDVVDPVSYLQEALGKNEKDIGYGREIALSGRRQAREALDRVWRAELVEDYVQAKATDSMTEAAMFALEKTEQRIRQDKEQYGKSSLEKNPLYISPESWQPESYGGHPDELKKLVLQSREKMAKELEKTRGYSQKKAEETAERHIKATIDIGHLNTWKRFYVKKPGESQDSYEKRFENWVLDKTKDLAKNKIIGHVHLSDNYGYHDEHLTIGDGNAPIKKFLEIMKKTGVDEYIVESGSFNPLTALPRSWNFLGAPVYSIWKPGLSDQTWGDSLVGGFHQSYFGRTEPPRYIIGEYSPSEDYKGSPFYSGTPLE